MAYTEATVLGIVKGRLTRLPADTSLDDHLKLRINAVDEELKSKGITLVKDDVADSVFLADIVVWQYQNRDKSGAMPDWLRLARRERFLSSKGRETNDTG